MCAYLHGDSGTCSVVKGHFSALVTSFILAFEAFLFEEHIPYETIVPVFHET